MSGTWTPAQACALSHCHALLPKPHCFSRPWAKCSLGARPRGGRARRPGPAAPAGQRPSDRSLWPPVVLWQWEASCPTLHHSSGCAGVWADPNTRGCTCPCLRWWVTGSRSLDIPEADAGGRGVGPGWPAAVTYSARGARGHGPQSAMVGRINPVSPVRELGGCRGAGRRQRAGEATGAQQAGGGSISRGAGEVSRGALPPSSAPSTPMAARDRATSPSVQMPEAHSSALARWWGADSQPLLPSAEGSPAWPSLTPGRPRAPPLPGPS